MKKKRDSLTNKVHYIYETILIERILAVTNVC
jgi:hypothetical protein